MEPHHTRPPMEGAGRHPINTDEVIRGVCHRRGLGGCCRLRSSSRSVHAEEPCDVIAAILHGNGQRRLAVFVLHAQVRAVLDK